MKKFYLLISLVCSMMLVACGLQSDTVETQEENDTKQESIESSEPIESTVSLESSESSDLDSNSSIEDTEEEEEEIFDVEITVSKEISGERTQEELDKFKEKRGLKSATLNPDGSVTYVMTEKQHNEMMLDIKYEIVDSMVAKKVSNENPNIVSVEYNEDYTKFTVTTKSNELSIDDGKSALDYIIYGETYNAYNGTPVDNIEIEWICESTGEVYRTLNSRDLMNME